jgi:hypothetical protein
MPTDTLVTVFPRDSDVPKMYFVSCDDPNESRKEGNALLEKPSAWVNSWMATPSEKSHALGEGRMYDGPANDGTILR